MKLRVIQDGMWTICAPILGNKDLSTFELFIDEVGGNYEANLAGIAVLIEQHANMGSKSFNTSQCHYVDQADQIYEYIKGKLRVFWFEDEGRVIVCTHGILKKSQKTPKADIEKAKRIKGLYLKAKQDSRIELLDEE